MQRLLAILLMIAICMTAPAQTRNRKQKQRQPSQKEQLQSQQKKVAKQRQANQQRQRELEQQVKKRMQDVEALASNIDDNRIAIERLALSVDSLNGNIAVIDSQLVVLQKELEERRQHYIKSVRYMYRNHNAQNRMMFILSARNFNQMYRRMRFMKEYTTYQRAQGEAVKQKGEQVAAKRNELDSARTSLRHMLAQGQAEQQQMEQRQAEQQRMVADLQKQQQTVKRLIAEQQKEEAELNRQIERLIAQEIERARKAEEERQRQLAEQRRREQEQQEARQQASNNRNSRSSRNSRRSNSRSTASTTTTATRTPALSPADPDRQLSGSFANNKGRLPVPITGSYRVIRNFGRYTLAGVTLYSNGIQLQGENGAQARCVFDGVVSTVANPGNGIVVMVRHGKYISVYGNLASASVSIGQKVKTNQTLGTVGASHVLVFRLQNLHDLSNALNPKHWLRRL